MLMIVSIPKFWRCIQNFQQRKAGNPIQPIYLVLILNQQHPEAI